MPASLPNLSDLSHEQKDELIIALFSQVQALIAQQTGLHQRIVQLESQLRLNSRNSSKPPSSDGLSKPAPKSLRLSGERANGGQKGHPGNTLRQSAAVDQTIAHQAHTQCSVCHLQMQAHEVIETRQIFELPELRVRVIAHQQIRSACACGATHVGAWPQGVNAPAQQGASVKAMAVNLNQYHLVPLARTSALMQDLYGLSPSQASIQSFAQDAACSLQATVAAIGQAVQAAPVVLRPASASKASCIGCTAPSRRR